MKFNVWFFSPELEFAVKGWGETSVVLFAPDRNQALHKFRDLYPSWDYLVRKIEEVPQCVFHDNVELRGVQTQKSNFTLDPENPAFEEFFAFDGLVHKASSTATWKASETMFVWNGRFDWVGG